MARNSAMNTASSRCALEQAQHAPSNWRCVAKRKLSAGRVNNSPIWLAAEGMGVAARWLPAVHMPLDDLRNKYYVDAPAGWP